MFGEVEADLRRSHPLQHLRSDRDAGTNDAFHHYRSRADIGRRNLKATVCGKCSLQFLGRQIAAIAADTREEDLQRSPLLDGVDARDRLRRGWLCLLRGGGEVKRDSHDVGIFDVEQSRLWVEIVGLTAQT